MHPCSVSATTAAAATSCCKRRRAASASSARLVRAFNQKRLNKAAKTQQPAVRADQAHHFDPSARARASLSSTVPAIAAYGMTCICAMLISERAVSKLTFASSKRLSVFLSSEMTLLAVLQYSSHCVLRLRSLWFHSPRLCRVAVFLIQTNVSLLCPCVPKRWKRGRGRGLMGVWAGVGVGLGVSFHVVASRAEGAGGERVSGDDVMGMSLGLEFSPSRLPRENQVGLY